MKPGSWGCFRAAVSLALVAGAADAQPPAPAQTGVPLARIASSGAGITVRWERAFLVPIPDSLLKTGSTILMVRPDGEPVSKRVRMTAPEIGAQSRLVPGDERRSFLVRTRQHRNSLQLAD